MKEEKIKKGLILIQYCCSIAGIILSLNFIFDISILAIGFINQMAIIVLESEQTPELRFLMLGTMVYLLSGLAGLFINIAKCIINWIFGEKNEKDKRNAKD